MASREEIRRVSIFINGKQGDLTLKQLSSSSRKLYNELAKLPVGSEAARKKMMELKQVNKVLRDVRGEVRQVGGAFSWLKTEIGKGAGLLAGFFGVQAVIGQVRNIISQNSLLSDSLADVQKTTGLTETSVRRLNEEFKKFDTRSSQQELLGLAEVAGKLGISAETDVLGFVRAADQINVALGKDLGNAEQAVNDLGKLVDIFRVKDAYGLEDALIRTGSAINSLGAAGTANEGYIVDFTKRVGGVAPAAGISIENVLGLAATLDELGQSAEVSSTTYTNVIPAMFKDTATFARIAGVDVGEFTKLLNTDTNEAFIRLLEGLNGNNQGMGEMVMKLDELGIQGARSTQVLSVLAGNTDKLRASQKFANEEFTEGTSLADEFATKNNNLAATLEKIGKFFLNIATDSSILTFLTKAAQGFARLIGLTQLHSEKLANERIELNKLEIKITSANTKQEDRIKLINQLKGLYPQYLGYLDAEKASNEEIAKAVKLVNDQLVNKIILARKDEEISKQNEVIAKNRIKQFEYEDQILTRLVKMRERFPQFETGSGSPAEQLGNLVRQYNESQDALGKTTGGIFDPFFGVAPLLNDFEAVSEFLNTSLGKGNKLAEERVKLLERLGISDLDTTSGGGPTTVPPIPPVNPESPITPTGPGGATSKKAIKDAEKLADDLKKVRAEIFIDRLQGQDKEIEQARVHFEKLKEQAKGKIAALIEIADLEGKAMAAINEKYAAETEKKRLEHEEAVKEFKQQIALEAADEYEKERLQLDYRFETAIAQAEELGLQTYNIERMWQQAKTDLLVEQHDIRQQREQEHNRKLYQEELKTVDQRKQLATSVISAISSMYTAVAGDAAAYSSFAKALAITQILIDTASAISSAVKGGAAVGITPFEKALAIAGNIALVMANMVKARQVLSQAEEPEPPQFKYGGYSAVDYSKPNGFVNRPTLFANSASGRSFIAGEGHKTEYIVSSEQLKDPVIADFVAMIEGIRSGRQFELGGYSRADAANSPKTGPVTINADNSEITSLLRTLISEVKKEKNQGFNYRLWKEQEALYNRLNTD